MAGSRKSDPARTRTRTRAWVAGGRVWTIVADATRRLTFYVAPVNKCNDDCRAFPHPVTAHHRHGSDDTESGRRRNPARFAEPRKRRQNDTSPTNPQRCVTLARAQRRQASPIDTTQSTGCIPPALCAVRLPQTCRTPAWGSLAGAVWGSRHPERVYPLDWKFIHPIQHTRNHPEAFITSLINAITFPSLSRKNASHRSRSPRSATSCGPATNSTVRLSSVA